jgi:hypothetical protein
MSFRRKLGILRELSESFLRQPGLSLKLFGHLPTVRRGFNYAQRWQSAARTTAAPLLHERGPTATATNPLRAFFDARQTGRGIWKWVHYFDIYDRHFRKFVGSDVNVLEIGVYSGGSLEMWRHYFGPRCRVYGVDIEAACSSYNNEYTEIVVGDQGDRAFWKAFKERVPAIDILIDDGGHQIDQQIVTLEEMLPHLRPGGVYLCEDVLGEHNGFSAFMHGLVHNLHTSNLTPNPDSIRSATEFQAWIRSIHFYPYVTVIEKAEHPMRQLVAPRHGTEWQPFL